MMKGGGGFGVWPDVLLPPPEVTQPKNPISASAVEAHLHGVCGGGGRGVRAEVPANLVAEQNLFMFLPPSP